MNFYSKNKWLIGIIFISFVASLVYSFVYRIIPAVDAHAYDQIAVNLVGGFGFREDATKSYEFDTSIVRAGPGYEFFLAGIYVIFGHHYEAVWIIQALLHAGSAGILFFIAKRIFHNDSVRIGLLAAALFGLSPDLIEISAMLMTETLYLFLIIAMLGLFIRVYENDARYSTQILLGIISALSILTRPPTVLCIPLFLYWYIRQKKFIHASLFLGAAALCIAPWIIRNMMVYHQFIPTTLIGQYNLWVGNTLLANGGQISGGPNPLTAYTDVYGFFSLKQKATHEFFLFIVTYPFVFFKLCLIRFTRFFSLIRPMGFWFYQTGIKQLLFVISSGISISLLFFTGFSGMLYALRQKKNIYYYLIIFALTAPLVLIPTVVQSRYRFQIYPFLTLFGSYFIISLVRKLPHAKKIAIYVAAFFLIITAIDCAMFFPTIIDRLGTFGF